VTGRFNDWVAIWGRRVGKEQPPAGMNVQFSPSQLLVSRVNTVVSDGFAPPALAAPMPLQGMAELHGKLNDLSLARRDKMDAARPLVSSANYPPEKLFNSIAHLLAIHLTN
jgi:hypothetical protein